MIQVCAVLDKQNLKRFYILGPTV